MYEKGDFIIYGTKGVCEVKDVTMTAPYGVSEEKLYYILVPVSTPASTVYSPVENGSVFTRTLISPEDAKSLLEEIPELEEVEVLREKDREQAYKDCVRSCSCRENAKLIKTLYHRKQMRQAIGKKVTATDDRYMKLAEESLYSELAHQLHMERSDLSEIVTKQLQKA